MDYTMSRVFKVLQMSVAAAATCLDSTAHGQRPTLFSRGVRVLISGHSA